MLRIKRVYDLPSETDGKRILIDRLWPRGIRKDKAKVDLWLKDLAPSEDLRKWFSHDSTKFEEFKARYTKELDSKREMLLELAREAKKSHITLLYASKEKRYNHAVVLKELIDKLMEDMK